mmetsp:Transcript_77880/g.210573  ORF Transcript_77880/g.210573 Transcript_77880/m.210573 type:complete len:238 (-) Transcript_77880:90-803(-)
MSPTKKTGRPPNKQIRASMAKGCLELPGCSRPMTVCHDDFELDCMMQPFPVCLSTEDMLKSIPAWVNKVVTPLVGKIAMLQADLAQCQSTIAEMSGQSPTLVVKVPRKPALSSSPEDNRVLVGTLEMRMQELQAAVSSMKASQAQSLERLQDIADKVANTGAGAAEDDLDFGAPISGRTLNTQDMAVMTTETRHEVDKLRKRVDDIDHKVLSLTLVPQLAGHGRDPLLIKASTRYSL